jgi:hypothetical protein
MSFVKREKCLACGQTAYNNESVRVGQGEVYHTTCFKCKECKKTLTASNFTSVDGHIFCKTDYERLTREGKLVITGLKKATETQTQPTTTTPKTTTLDAPKVVETKVQEPQIVPVEVPKKVEPKVETPKVEVKPEVKKEEVKPVEVKKEEVKPVEVKKEEPKVEVKPV